MWELCAGCGMQRLEEVLADMGERVESEEDAVALDVAELAALELGQLAVRAPEAKGAQHCHTSHMQGYPGLQSCRALSGCFTVFPDTWSCAVFVCPTHAEFPPEMQVLVQTRKRMLRRGPQW